MKTQNEQEVARVPVGKLCVAPESQPLSQLKHPVPSQQTGSLGLGGPWAALLFFSYPIGESIEILVSPFFCLSPTHTVLSLVSHFSFLS